MRPKRYRIPLAWAFPQSLTGSASSYTAIGGMERREIGGGQRSRIVGDQGQTNGIAHGDSLSERQRLIDNPVDTLMVVGRESKATGPNRGPHGYNCGHPRSRRRWRRRDGGGWHGGRRCFGRCGNGCGQAGVPIHGLPQQGHRRIGQGFGGGSGFSHRKWMCGTLARCNDGMVLSCKVGRVRMCNIGNVRQFGCEGEEFQRHLGQFDAGDGGQGAPSFKLCNLIGGALIEHSL